MTNHYVTVDIASEGYTARCTCGGFNKKYPSRNLACAFSHLHIAGINIDLLELVSAGKADHD